MRTTKTNGLKTVSGTYGSLMTPCDVFVFEYDGGFWYAVSGSRNVNFTYDEPMDGVDVEEVIDYDSTTSGWDIDSENDLFVHVIDDELDEMDIA